MPPDVPTRVKVAPFKGQQGAVDKLRLSCHGATVEVNREHYDKLRVLFAATAARRGAAYDAAAFTRAAMALLLRYSSLQGTHYRGGGFQARPPLYRSTAEVWQPLHVGRLFLIELLCCTMSNAAAGQCRRRRIERSLTSCAATSTATLSVSRRPSTAATPAFARCSLTPMLPSARSAPFSSFGRNGAAFRRTRRSTSRSWKPWHSTSLRCSKPRRYADHTFFCSFSRRARLRQATPPRGSKHIAVSCMGLLDPRTRGAT